MTGVYDRKLRTTKCIVCGGPFETKNLGKYCQPCRKAKTRQQISEWKAANPRKVRESNKVGEKERGQRYRDKHPDRVQRHYLEMGADGVVNIRDRYVKQLLRNQGVPVLPETIEFKRAQVRLIRSAQKLKSTLKTKIEQYAEFTPDVARRSGIDHRQNIARPIDP